MKLSVIVLIAIVALIVALYVLRKQPAADTFDTYTAYQIMPKPGESSSISVASGETRIRY